MLFYYKDLTLSSHARLPSPNEVGGSDYVGIG